MPFVLTLQRFYGNNDTHQHSGTGSEYQQSSGALLLRRVCRDKPRLNLYNFPSQGNPKRSFSKQTIPINRSSPYKYLDKNPITSRNPRKLQSSIHTRIQFLEHLRKLIFKAGPKQTGSGSAPKPSLAWAPNVLNCWEAVICGGVGVRWQVVCF